VMTTMPLLLLKVRHLAQALRLLRHQNSQEPTIECDEPCLFNKIQVPRMYNVNKGIIWKAEGCRALYCLAIKQSRIPSLRLYRVLDVNNNCYCISDMLKA